VNELILIGGGGHCKSCIDVIEAEGKFQIIGIVDQKEKIGQSVLDYKIIASDEELPNLVKEFNYFHITIGQIGAPKLRMKIYNQLKELEAELPIIISPKAHVSKYSSIGEGSIIMHYAMVNADAKIGINSIINTRALVEHDVIIGNFCHLATGAIVNGNTLVNDFSFIGSGAVTKQGAIIPENSFVKANSLFK
jgi:sugar O-acyltransferase (sialic acid O-acetyltransferase NeuD family)